MFIVYSDRGMRDFNMKARRLKGNVWTDRYVPSFTETTSLIAPTSINRRAQIFICRQRKVVNFIQTHISCWVLSSPRDPVRQLIREMSRLRQYHSARPHAGTVSLGRVMAI